MKLGEKQNHFSCPKWSTSSSSTNYPHPINSLDNETIFNGCHTSTASQTSLLTVIGKRRMEMMSQFRRSVGGSVGALVSRFFDQSVHWVSRFFRQCFLWSVGFLVRGFSV